MIQTVRFQNKGEKIPTERAAIRERKHSPPLCSENAPPDAQIRKIRMNRCGGV